MKINGTADNLIKKQVNPAINSSISVGSKVRKFFFAGNSLKNRIGLCIK